MKESGSDFDAAAVTAWLPFVLQASDPLFPTGAYAHSLGLEELAANGTVRDSATLEHFLREQVLPGLERLELPYLRLGWEAAQRPDFAVIGELAAELDAVKVAEELRRASVQLGSRRLQTLLAACPSEMLRRFAASGASTHHVLVCSLQFSGIPMPAALASYLYQSIAGFCAAALKLIRIGAEGCQRVLSAVLAEANAIIARSRQVSREECGWFNPLLDIAGMRHALSPERLFIS